MSNTTGVCACVGPAGDCPCLRKNRGPSAHEIKHIPVTFISEDLLSFLSEQDNKAFKELTQKLFLSNEDVDILSTIRQKAFFAWVNSRNTQTTDLSKA